MLASQEDVEARLGRMLTVDESSRVAGLLEEASELAIGWLRCTPDPVPSGVRIVVSRMVARLLSQSSDEFGAPNGASSIQASAGGYQLTKSYGSDSSSSAPWLTRADKTALRRHGCRGRVGNVGAW